MNKLKNFFTIILLFTIIIFLFKYSYILNTSVIDAVNMWLTKIFPSLFIMFIVNDIIINTNVLNSITNFIDPIFNKLFKTSGKSSEIFLLSIFSGTPSSAFIINESLSKNKIDLDSANKLIAFTYFSNPLFLYNILNLTFNTFITTKIIIIHYLSNLIIGLIFSLNSNRDTYFKNINNSYTKQNIFLILPNSIKKSINTLIMILGALTFYMIITNIATLLLNLPNTLEIILKGIMEITQCLSILKNIHSTSIIKEIIAISIISFGGLSIHSQVISLISNAKIKYKNFILGRILHALISAMAYICFYFLIPC